MIYNVPDSLANFPDADVDEHDGLRNVSNAERDDIPGCRSPMLMYSPPSASAGQQRKTTPLGSQASTPTGLVGVSVYHRAFRLHQESNTSFHALLQEQQGTLQLILENQRSMKDKQLQLEMKVVDLHRQVEDLGQWTLSNSLTSSATGKKKTSKLCLVNFL